MSADGLLSINEMALRRRPAQEFTSVIPDYNMPQVHQNLMYKIPNGQCAWSNMSKDRKTYVTEIFADAKNPHKLKPGVGNYIIKEPS